MRVAGIFVPGVAMVLLAGSTHAELAPHLSVTGADVATVEITDARRAVESAAWDDLARTPRGPGVYALRARVGGVDAVEVPACAGRRNVRLNGARVQTQNPGPLVVRLPPGGATHDLTFEVVVSAYEKRIACGAAMRGGTARATTEGLGLMTFASPHGALGGGRAVVYVPPGHDSAKPAAVLVGAHPWGGSPWTYAAYAELLHAAAVRDVVLLMPSALGNSLYTAPAEDEVVRAIDALSAHVAVDPRRVSIWGASMGGAGATTIGLHRPDRFATITSLFGDSRYDLSTYVRAILKDEAAAHAVNALDVADNARHLPVWLIHGEDDRVSPITQSLMLARALTERRYAVRFDRIPNAGHEGPLVARFAAEIVEGAASAHAPENPSRITFKSVRAQDTDAYGVHIERAGGDAFVDVERRTDGIHVLQATGIKSIAFARGALGAPDGAPIVVDAPVTPISVRWQTATDAGADAPSGAPR
jgi:pimeloyl-ACP methyl ester carboxylesterase